MIHDELGRAWVQGEDGPEGVDLRSPLADLLCAEAAAELGREESLVVALEAVRALHGWVCAAGPHPRVVAERLVKATAHYAPGITGGLERHEVQAVAGVGAERERALLRMLLDDERAGARALAAHGARILGALGRASRREGGCGRGGEAAPRLEALLAEDMLAGEAEEELRREAARRWLARMWQGGGLLSAMKAFYALSRSFWPELVLNMGGEEIAAFFGQTRAAESERVHRLVNMPVERHTGRHVAFRFQKSVGARGKYAAAQLGNQHRANAAKRSEAAA